MSPLGRTRAMVATAAATTIALLALAVGCARDDGDAGGGLAQGADADFEAGGRPGDVLLVTIDTLRADHLSLYGYRRDTSPNLERIFADGAVFERAYAASAYTSASTASLLSGRLPQDHGVRMFDQLFPQDVAMVTELLPDAYQTAAIVSTKILSDGATGLAKRFDHFDDEIGDRQERIAASTTDAALAWLEHARDADRPAFLWVHYKDPHAPYAPPDALRGRYRREQPSGLDLKRIPAYARLEGADDPLDYVDRYDEEIAYTDAEVGRLVDGYARLAPLDDALLVLTADHGESLVERPFWFVHANHVFEEQVRVPLALRGPGVAPGRSLRLVSGVDVLPTLLAFAGGRVPDGLPGVDLLAAPPHGDGDRVVFVESIHYLNGRQWRAAIQGESKWMVLLDGQGDLVRRKRSYDLATDPDERKPLPWRDASPGRRLLELVHADPDPAGLPAEAERGTLVEENPLLLKALGYLQ